MTNYVTGTTIRELREKKKYTQKQLAELLCVSDKAVSKWENDRGLPDISLLEPLARVLSVSVAELLSGEYVINRNRSANMLRGSFYVCPLCGNVLYASGESLVSCCGITLPKLETEEPEEIGEHAIHVEKVDCEHYVTMEHPMGKDHYLSFFAYVTCDRVQILKQYPEQNPAARFPIFGHGWIYAYCNRHGLYSKRV